MTGFLNAPHGPQLLAPCRRPLKLLKIETIPVMEAQSHIIDATSLHIGINNGVIVLEGRIPISDSNNSSKDPVYCSKRVVVLFLNRSCINYMADSLNLFRASLLYAYFYIGIL